MCIIYQCFIIQCSSNLLLIQDLREHQTYASIPITTPLITDAIIVLNNYGLFGTLLREFLIIKACGGCVICHVLLL